MTNGVYASKNIAQSYLRPTVENEEAKAACGSACGAAEPKAACGSACGAADPKPEEKPSACGSACGAGDAK